LVLPLSRPPGPQGFLLRSVTRLPRPCLLSTTRGSATLRPSPVSGSPYRERFSTSCGSLEGRAVGLSLGKSPRLPRSRPASLRFGSPDIRSRSLRPARPPPRCHLAGSLFATYPGSASCFLRTCLLGQCPCPVGVALPSGHGERFTSGQRPEGRRVRHARRTSTTTTKGGGLKSATTTASKRGRTGAHQTPLSSLYLPGTSRTS
jgi:hypothetical protein